MRCLLIFDYSNDIIYTNYNAKFAAHINEFARSQGLLNAESDQSNDVISSNIIVQIFSPLVTSQRVMSCQFGNSYSSIECEDGLNVIFEEYMGYLFVNIGSTSIIFMKRFLSVCVTLVRYLCGPDVMQLKHDTDMSKLLTRLIDGWVCLYNTEQLMLVEAIEQLMVNSDLSAATLQAVNEAVEKLQTLVDSSKTHALIFVDTKCLSLYSSSKASPLSPRDMLFLILLCNITCCDRNAELEDEKLSDPKETTCSYQVLLSGNDFTPKCIPHVVHVTPIIEGVHLLLIIEVGISSVSSSLYDTFYNLNLIQTIQMQQDTETLKPAVENLDITTKKLIDSLKKTKSNTLELSLKQLIQKWDYMKKKYMDFFKNNSSDSLLRAESCTMNFLDILKKLLGLTAFDNSVLNSSQSCVEEIAQLVSEKLEIFNEFFKAKARRNFTLGSRDSLTINKYLEEFPGLVHFIYVDRTTHRVITPTLDFTTPETMNLTKKKVWEMINFSRNHLQEGHLSIMWKDTTFNYSYFLWFEDTSGSPISPTIFPTNTQKALPSPGLLCGDFYLKLKEACFPKTSPNKVRCYELFCIHLGLVTASCVLEHTRRLSATIWELRGHPNHPIDLL